MGELETQIEFAKLSFQDFKKSYEAEDIKQFEENRA